MMFGKGDKMKRPILYCLSIAFLLICIGCASRNSPLVGTWHLIEAQGQPVTGNTIKIVTPTHFAFGRNEGPGAVWAGGGRVQVTRSVYTEIIQYHSKPGLVGKVLDFSYDLKNDRWHHRSILKPGRQALVIDEVWERVDD